MRPALFCGAIEKREKRSTPKKGGKKKEKRIYGRGTIGTGRFFAGGRRTTGKKTLK